VLEEAPATEPLGNPPVIGSSYSQFSQKTETVLESAHSQPRPACWRIQNVILADVACCAGRKGFPSTAAFLVCRDQSDAVDTLLTLILNGSQTSSSLRSVSIVSHLYVPGQVVPHVNIAEL